MSGLLAQLVEQRTLNPLVECSSHSGPTKFKGINQTGWSLFLCGVAKNVATELIQPIGRTLPCLWRYVCVAFHHRARLPSFKPLQLVSRCPGLSVPRCERVAQVMLAEVLNLRTTQRSCPGFGVHIRDWVAPERENVGRVVAHLSPEHGHGHVVERNRVRLAVLVLASRYPGVLPR